MNHTIDIYDCQDPRCQDWVRVGLAQDKGNPTWHVNESERENVSL